MRAPLRDVRVEAVAGAPWADVQMPTRFEAFPGGTVIFAGKYVWRENTYSAGQGTISGTQATGGTLGYQYITGNPAPSAGARSVFPVGATTISGSLVTVVHEAPAAAPLVLGAAGSTPAATIHANNTRWEGPMRAVAYNHTLTPDQIAEVARRLAASLG